MTKTTAEIVSSEGLTPDEVKTVEKLFLDHPGISEAIADYNRDYSKAIGALRKLAETFYKSPIEDRLRSLMLRHKGVDKSMISRLKSLLALPKGEFAKFVEGTYSMQQALSRASTSVGAPLFIQDGKADDVKRWRDAVQSSLKTMALEGKRVRLVFKHSGYQVKLSIIKIKKAK